MEKVYIMNKAVQKLSIPYCSNKRNICIIVQVITVILCIFTVFVYNNTFKTGEDIEYPLEQSVDSYDPYVQQFDAFMKGQLYIDYAPDEKLAELENPYDRAQREDVTYLWDRSYYDGRYYSYFGTTPVFTVIYPYYFLTGKIPAASTIQLIFMLMFAVFFPLLIMVLGKKLSKRITPVMLSLIAYTAFVSSLQMLMARGRSAFYYIAATSAMAFLAMFAFLFFKGIFSERFKSRCIYFLFAGLAFALCFHSRINVAFGAVFFIIPMLVFGIILKKRKLRERIIELCSLAFFVIIGFVLSFIYNYLRFGDIFEFGASYQLTVADVSTYKLDIKEIGYAIYCYFIAPLKDSIITDSLVFTNTKIAAVDRYLYIDKYFGIFAVPFMLASLTLPFVLIDKSKNFAYRVTMISSFVGMFIMAWVDFCMGGVIFRYLCDISVIMAVISAVCMFSWMDKILSIENATYKRILNYLVIFVLVIALYRTFQIMAVEDGNLFKMNYDSIFYKLFG